MATNGTAHEEHPTSSQSSELGGNKPSSVELSQEEVGWYFVEQYYKTLNKNPDKLHLFYSKNSQYLVGKDAELTQVSIGRAAIQERIKGLDLENCKVRISNVDTQACDDKIVIQTIGHTANKEGEPKKFVQTFVLAQQPSGYFVLNDIMRYMPDQDWESEETAPAAEEATAAADQEAEPVAAAEPEAAVEVPTKKAEPVEPEAVAEKLAEEAAPVSEAAAPAVEAPAAEPAPEAEEPAVEEKAESTPEPAAAAQEAAVEDVKKVEEPKETPAAPVAAPQAPTAAEPEKPRQPPKPMTWASRLAASSGAPVRPVVPVTVPKAATPSATAQPRQPAPAAAQATPAAPAPEAAPAPAAAKDQGSEWQTAETRRQNKPQAASAAPAKKEDNMAYIKFVTDKVQDEDLKSFLAGFGELEYFDINRQKNCAFVEFKTKAGYNAALAASPHTINGENIIIEQRRPKANAYGGSNYPRGGAAPRGRGGFESGRTGSPGAGRGGFSGQSRGRGGAPRGRGGPQASAA